MTKYFVCKQYPLVAYEALECLGGNGYVEDFPMARLYRQAPLNAVWEGSGNVLALDVLRTLAKVYKFNMPIHTLQQYSNNCTLSLFLRLYMCSPMHINIHAFWSLFFHSSLFLAYSSLLTLVL